MGQPPIDPARRRRPGAKKKKITKAARAFFNGRRRPHHFGFWPWREKKVAPHHFYSDNSWHLPDSRGHRVCSSFTTPLRITQPAFSQRQKPKLYRTRQGRGCRPLESGPFFSKEIGPLCFPTPTAPGPHRASHLLFAKGGYPPPAMGDRFPHGVWQQNLRQRAGF